MSETPRPIDGSEIANMFILAIAGLVMAWSGYQGTLWTNERLARTSASGALSSESVRLAERADTIQAVEIGLFGAWLDASIAGDTARAAAYAARFPPSLRKAFDAWLLLRPETNAEAPSSPFGLEDYMPTPRLQAAEVERRARAASASVDQAMRITEEYAQSEGILSVALFFAGVGQVFRARTTRWVLVSLAALACAVGTWRMLMLPAIWIMQRGP
jgi:hypothetical protein